MLKRGDRVDENISFWSLLRNTKIGTLTWKYPIFYFSIIVAYGCYRVFKVLSKDTYVSLFPYISDTIASISATLMGIILAGLAIIVGLAVGDILNLLLKGKILQKLLFPFWFVTLLWAVSTLTAISLYFIPYLVNKEIEIIFLSFQSFIFTYALLGTVSLIGSTIKIMVLIAELVPKD